MLKVLIVDDEDVARRGIALSVDWGAMDCVVVGEASNGEEGIAAVERYNPSLIITDVRMPRMDGITMMRELRRRGCKAYAIMLTAHNDFEYVRSALQFGADDYLLKPFENQELVAAIGRVCKKNQERRPMLSEDFLPPLEGGKSRYVAQTLDYISKHYKDKDIGISSIARYLNVSEGHLSHVFKKETSYTVLNYLTHYRIHMAMKLLAEGNLRVGEVAEELGYRDVNYFGNTFKRMTGMSPSEYQERCR